jgi:hypothetical protein
MISLFWLLLPWALACVDGGSRKPHHVVAAVLAWLLDLFIARVQWRALAGPLHGSERTISDSLERLCWDYQNPDYALFIQIAKKINRISPTHDHIKAVL